jgi:hypothetical protein
MAPAVPVDTPPEIAVIVAVPFDEPARNLATTRPLMSVSASAGTIDPNVLVNVTCVPFWGGVPAGSMTCAMISADPLTGSAVTEVVSVIVDPDGARSGTLSQVTLSARTAASISKTEALRGITMKRLDMLFLCIEPRSVRLT